MSSKAIEAARAFVRVNWEDSAFRRGISAASGMMRSFVSGIAKVGIGNLLTQGITKATAAVFDFAASGAAIDDVSKRTGASTEALSQLKYAAEQGGASLEDVEKSGRKLGQVLTDAGAGGKTAAASLAAVGLSAKDLEGMSFEQQLMAVAEGLKGIDDPGAKAAAAMDLLGKSGANLLPMMEDGAAGMQLAMTEADKLGMTVSGDQAKAAAGFDDAWGKLKSTFATVGKVIGAVILPRLTMLMDIAAVAIPVLLDMWVQLNNAFINGAKAAWEAITKLTTGFKPLFDAVKETFSAIGTALQSGEYAAAADVLWQSLKVAWLTGIDALNQEWLIWKFAFIETFQSAIDTVSKKWHEVQAMLSKGVVSVMAFFDSSINVEDVSNEIDAMTAEKLKNLERESKASQADRERKFETDISQVNQDLEAARAAWRSAVDKATATGEDKANDPAASEVADDKFTQLVNELRAGDIATRVNDAAKSNTVGDIRSTQGAGQLLPLMNRETEVSKRTLGVLDIIAANTNGLQKLLQPQVVNI